MSATGHAYLDGVDALSILRPLVSEELVDEDAATACDEVRQVADRAVAEVEAGAGNAPVPSALKPFAAEESAAPGATAPSRLLASEISGVSDEAWTRFAMAMRTAAPSAVSASNALGMFEMKPRRLADLGLVTNVSCTRSPTGRMVWVGEFVRPLTSKAFLGSPKIQYAVFAASMRQYADSLRAAADSWPDGATLSGLLAVLHRCGPGGLKNWGDADKRFPDTVALFEKANGIF